MKISPKEDVPFNENSKHSRIGQVIIADYLGVFIRGEITRSYLESNDKIGHKIKLSHDVELPYGEYKMKCEFLTIIEDEIIGIISDELQK